LGVGKSWHLLRGAAQAANARRPWPPATRRTRNGWIPGGDVRPYYDRIISGTARPRCLGRREVANLGPRPRSTRAADEEGSGRDEQRLWAGGSEYSPTTSRSLVAKTESGDSLKRRARDWRSSPSQAAPNLHLCWLWRHGPIFRSWSGMAAFPIVLCRDRQVSGFPDWRSDPQPGPRIWCDCLGRTVTRANSYNFDT